MGKAFKRMSKRAKSVNASLEKEIYYLQHSCRMMREMYRELARVDLIQVADPEYKEPEQHHNAIMRKALGERLLNGK
jgi:hypothetical protein